MQTQLSWQVPAVSYCLGVAHAFPDVCCGPADPLKQCLGSHSEHGSYHQVAVCSDSANCLLNVLNKLGGECAGEFGE